jgi:hypothetical protein
MASPSNSSCHKYVSAGSDSLLLLEITELLDVIPASVPESPFVLLLERFSVTSAGSVIFDELLDRFSIVAEDDAPVDELAGSVAKELLD